MTWARSDDGTLTISGSGSMGEYGWADELPWYGRAAEIKKAVIERNKDIAVEGNDTTAEKYVLAGNASLEEGASYDVLAHYWSLGDEILSKGVIR